MTDDRLAGQIKRALAQRRLSPSRQLSERLEAVAQRAARPWLSGPAVLALAVAAGVLLVIAWPHGERSAPEDGLAMLPASDGRGTADGSVSLPGAPVTGLPASGTITPGTPAPGTPAPAIPAPGTPAPGTPAPGTLMSGTSGPGTSGPGTPAPGTPASAGAKVDVRDPLARYQSVLDGASSVSIAPAQAAKLRALAAELASQRAYLAERKREAEAELARALAAANPDDSRVLAAYDRIAAHDAALGRAQLVARLGARAVLDPRQRSAIEGGAQRAPSSPPSDAGSSWVTVKSAVVSSVYLDGRYIGETPTKTRVSPGKHETRLDAPGYDSLFNHFEIGESSNVLLELEPHKRASPGTPVPSQGAETGHLTLTTQPWTSIYLDGKPVGQTPIQLTLAPGRHEIKMIGADQRTRKTMTLDVTPGQTSNLSFSFDD